MIETRFITDQHTAKIVAHGLVNGKTKSFTVTRIDASYDDEPGWEFTVNRDDAVLIDYWLLP